MKPGPGVVVAAVVVLTVTAGAAFGERRYVAERFDVDLQVLPEGRLEIIEHIQFRFDGGPFTYVFREIPLRRTDGIELMEASLQGQTLPRGTQPGQVEVAESRERIRVRWHFPPTSDAVRTFSLRYVVDGALTPDGDGSRLQWRALPAQHEYPMAAARVRLLGATSRPPEVTARRIGSTQVRAEDSGWVIDAIDVRRNGFVDLDVGLPLRPAIAPRWQQERQRQAAAAPRAAGLAALAGVLGLTALLAFRAQYPGKPPIDPAPKHRTEPPDSLPPCLAAALLTGGRPTQTHAVAALFEMAEQGLIVVEEAAPGALRTRRFIIRQAAEPHATLPWHAALLGILFPNRATELPLSKLGGRLVRKGRVFRRAASDALRHAGLLDEGRRSARRRVVTLGISLIVVAAIAAVLTALALSSLPFGPWAFLVPVAIGIVGLAAVVLGGSLSDLSDEGFRRMPQWIAFRRYLRDVARRRVELGDPAFAAGYLPYAAAFGLTGLWATWLKKRAGAVQVPPWFRAAAADEEGSAAFVALLGATAASTGGSGAGASSGAAGGGASGAG